MNSETMYEIIPVSTEQDWKAYHAIRRKVLWENRGRSNYNDQHEDEYLPHNHPLLFKLNGLPIGTTRLDNFQDGSGAVRRVAILDDFQRKGHGRRMAEMVDRHAENLSIKILFVNADHEALGFYKKLGWEPFVWDLSKLTGIAEDPRQMRKLLK
jgi:N-acetylglutamate synthase-like GNAT family acetyltransferase